MIEQSRLKFKMIIIVTIIVVVSFSCTFLDSEKIVLSENEFFAVDPATIQQEIYQGNNDVFTPQEESPYEANPLLGNPVQWESADYFSIAHALHELVWDESLEGWKLSFMNFSWDCAYFDNGSQYASFVYIKIIQNRNVKSRLSSSLIIEPRRNTVGVLKREYSPKVMHWDVIDLNQLEVSVEEALEIAEENGGTKTRMSVDNECAITLSLNPDLMEYGGWIVSYQKDDGRELAVYHINPITGELEYKE